ncbi:hypothetical protein CKF54_08000 [Psittacicella hinzii]|uniref:LexA-binding, inner membrane-associated hydrolase n=1 Tax=Psittacicella hinzii TaxID=2028575 RepID=A0A3A1XYE5_9GAMM|nr:metal-dependent hydrolase [Psittacicella hinzii]RIY31042.1 hypothetical protein CKF54_08000 [Psittacicella hinzii]
MYRKGHMITGINLGVCLTIGAINWFNVPYLIAIVSGYLTYKGSMAPDYLEMRWFDREKQEIRSIIPHRTITHWLLLWVACMVFAGYKFYQGGVWWLLPFAYCAGGVLHILLDLPNKKPIPIFLPVGGTCLKWWASNEKQGIICLITSLLMAGFIYLSFIDRWQDIATEPMKYWQAFCQQVEYEMKRLAG